MTEYAEKRNAFEIELYQGITYRNYLNALTHSQQTNLSDKLYEKLVGLKLTKSNIATMQKSLEAQFEDLQKMKNMFIMAGN